MSKEKETNLDESSPTCSEDEDFTSFKHRRNMSVDLGYGKPLFTKFVDEKTPNKQNRSKKEKPTSDQSFDNVAFQIDSTPISTKKTNKEIQNESLENKKSKIETPKSYKKGNQDKETTKDDAEGEGKQSISNQKKGVSEGSSPAHKTKSEGTEKTSPTIHLDMSPKSEDDGLNKSSQVENSIQEQPAGSNEKQHYKKNVTNLKSTEDRVEQQKTNTNPDENDDDNQPEERAVWGNSVEFLMSCIAMNVGLGNIWRFPFVAYENGGGAFLIPYLIVLTLLGRPMYYLEMCLGQFSSRGNVKMFEALASALKGVGYGQLIGTSCVATYYCSLMAITLFYLINSFTNHLPWSECNPSWANNSLLKSIQCVPSKSHNHTTGNNSVSSAELWFRLEVLKETKDISDGIGLPEWRLTLCLLVSWLTTFIVCAKGVQSSGKASYFLAIFPYVILITLFVRSTTLEGADIGILYFVKPKWEKLLDAKVWYYAVTQCFFSLNIGFGSVTMYASYNTFRHNVYRDAMVVTTLDTFTSFLAGMIIFGILGNLAKKMGVDVSQVVKSGGTGLAFISYPEAIARFEAVPWLFAILFFTMLFVLGVGSLVGLQGCAFTVIMDTYPSLKIWHVSLGTAVAGFIIGLVYVTPGGQYIFTMVDFFGGTFIFYVLTIVEVLSIMWWYGLGNICSDIEFMLKKKVSWYWRICWGILIPVVLLVVFLYFLATLEQLTYEGRKFPSNIIMYGWLLLGVALLQPFLWWLVEMFKNYRQRDSCSNAALKTLKHSNWGPKEESYRKKWKNFKIREKAMRELKHRSWFKDKVCVLLGR